MHFPMLLKKIFLNGPHSELVVVLNGVDGVKSDTLLLGRWIFLESYK